MSKQEAKEIIEQISKKYFAKEARAAWNIHGNADPPLWNIFALKAVSKEDCLKLGNALIELAREEKP